MANEIMVNNTQSIAAYTPSEYSTFSIKDKETRKMVLNAINDAESLNNWCKENPGGILHVIGCFTQPGVRRSRSADHADAPCTNTTLVCEDGRAFMTQSEGIRRSCDSFMASGLFDDGEVIDMKVSEKTIAGGNTIKHLIIV